jgi:hypothetical protein
MTVEGLGAIFTVAAGAALFAVLYCTVRPR